jgi:hypothetical protein
MVGLDGNARETIEKQVIANQDVFLPPHTTLKLYYACGNDLLKDAIHVNAVTGATGWVHPFRN